MFKLVLHFKHVTRWQVNLCSLISMRRLPILLLYSAHSVLLFSDGQACIWKTNIWRKTILRYFHLNWRIKKLLQLTPSWWRSLLYRNQSIDLHGKSMDWLLYNSDFRHERVKGRRGTYFKMLLSKLVKWISLIKGVAGNKINI